MSRQVPSVGLVLLTVVSFALMFGLVALGWGSWRGLVDHPARAGACAVLVASGVAAVFSGLNFSGFRRPDSHDTWILAPVAVVGLAAIFFPPYADRRDIATVDGDAIRYLGLALLAAGVVLRVVPMYVLGHRFTWPLATQEEHRLVTTGLYRFIRHPSYLGVLVSLCGWSLVFRCWTVAVLILLMLPLFGGVVRREEDLLLKEFGEPYAAYRRRTWRFLPFLY